jgi:2,5-diketo-D-gluconate reductase A
MNLRTNGTSTLQTVTLNNGLAMPQLGFGVWQVPDDQAFTAVTQALEAGYRSIDTARLYHNEVGTGRAIRESGVAREDVFLTTKLWNDDHGHDQALRAFDASVERLGTDYVDLYLIHWPTPSQGKYVDTWRALEKIAADGRAKAVGVSNFTVPTLTRLLAETDLVPAVNQIELHPYFAQSELRAFHAEHGIATEAWSPLGQGKTLLAEPVLTAIAVKHGKSAAQVVLRWHLQIGNVAIPKSVTPSRIRENIDVFDFELDADDLAAISGLDREDGRIGPDPATMNWLG